MSHPAEDLLRALARQMAAGQRVLLVGASFETLALLADAEVRELVIVSDDADPDAPDGETATGAPLRMRPDWKERPRSKDVILDPAGEMPAAEAVRILKKHGVYLSAVEGPALVALAHREAVTAERVGALRVPGELDGPFVQALAAEVEAEAGPVIHVAGHTAPSLPAAACLIPPPGVDRAALQAVETERDGLRADLLAAEARIVALEAERAAADAATAVESTRAELAEARLAEAADRAEGLQVQLDAALDAGANAEKALADKTTELAELETEFEAVRTELAERRVEDNRFARLRARFAEARDQMTAEVTALRARLREVDGPAVDAEELAASRERARAETVRLIARLSDTIERLAPDRRLPATPVPADDEAAGAALDAWLESVEGAVEAVAADLEYLREAEADWIDRGAQMGARLRELRAAVTALEAERDAPAARAFVAAPEPGELERRVSALEAALQAERDLRAAEAAERRRAIAAARDAEGVHGTLRAGMGDLRRRLAAESLGRAAAEDELRRLHAELEQRAARAAELEDVLTAHERMEGLLTAALQTAESRTEVAEDARRQAEANLRVLRAEFERRAG